MVPVDDAERRRRESRTSSWASRAFADGVLGLLAQALRRRLAWRDAVSGALESESFMHRLQRLLDRRCIADGAVLLFCLAEAQPTLKLLGSLDHAAVLRRVAELVQAQSPRAPLGRVGDASFALVLDDAAHAACVAAAVRAQVDRLSVGLRVRASAAAARAGVRLPRDDVLPLAVGVQAASGFTRAGPLLERCRERLATVAVPPDAGAAPALRG
jgi:GGDEF domain-containing protein